MPDDDDLQPPHPISPDHDDDDQTAAQSKLDFWMRRAARSPSNAPQPAKPFTGDPDEVESDDVTVVHERGGDECEEFPCDDRAQRLGHSVMERVNIRAALRASGVTDETDFDKLSSGEEQRARTLLDLVRQPLFKPHLIGDAPMLRRLERLAESAPNFKAVTALTIRAAALSRITGRALHMQPLVLLGPPGVGKTTYARKLTAALETTIEVINGSTLPDV